MTEDVRNDLSAFSDLVMKEEKERQQRQPSSIRADLLAYGEQEKDSAVTRRDRDAYQFWTGWVAALERVKGETT